VKFLRWTTNNTDSGKENWKIVSQFCVANMCNLQNENQLFLVFM